MAVYIYYHEVLEVTGSGSFQFSGRPKACDNASQFEQLDRYKRIWFVFAVPLVLSPTPSLGTSSHSDMLSA
jgi:hypothetical protein